MKEIRVVGDINKVQSNLDFYISVTSLDRDITVEEYKKSYFDGYIRDAKKELNDSIESVKKQIAEKKKEILKKQTVEKLKKERVEREKARRAEEERKAEEARKLEEQRKVEEAKRLEEAKKLEEQQRKSEEAKKLEEQRKVEEAKWLEEAKNQEERKIEEFKNAVNAVEECDHGVYLDECSVAEKNIASSGNVEYVSCGTDIDELLESNANEGNNSHDKDVQGDVEYVSCGTDIDELLDSDAAEDDDSIDKDKQENVEFVEQGTILEDCLDTQGIDSNEETSCVSDDSDEIEESSVPDVFDDSYDGEIFDDSFDEDDLDDSFDEDELDDFPLDQGIQSTKDDSTDIFDDIETEDVSQTEEDSSKIIPISSGVKKEVSMEDDGRFAENLPRDVRDFLKIHPNSDMSYVLKFYSKKDIDKQIKLGRIFKRKGKLMI